MFRVLQGLIVSGCRACPTSHLADGCALCRLFGGRRLDLISAVLLRQATHANPYQQCPDRQPRSHHQFNPPPTTWSYAFRCTHLAIWLYISSMLNPSPLESTRENRNKRNELAVTTVPTHSPAMPGIVGACNILHIAVEFLYPREGWLPRQTLAKALVAILCPCISSNLRATSQRLEQRSARLRDHPKAEGRFPSYPYRPKLETLPRAAWQDRDRRERSFPEKP